MRALAAREATALGCLPMLPRRVVYPEMVGGREEYLYDTEEELFARLTRVLVNSEAQCPPALRDEIAAHTVARVVSERLLAGTARGSVTSPAATENVAPCGVNVTDDAPRGNMSAS